MLTFEVHKLEHKDKKKCFGNSVKFDYSGRIPENQNYSHDEVKSSLKSVNACCHSVQGILSTSLVMNNVKINPYSANVENMVSS